MQFHKEHQAKIRIAVIFPKGTATGMVGIGTDDPKYTLDVIGNI